MLLNNFFTKDFIVKKTHILGLLQFDSKDKFTIKDETMKWDKQKKKIVLKKPDKMGKMY